MDGPIHKYKCPNCGLGHGGMVYNTPAPYRVLCNQCLNNKSTDPNLRIETLIFYVDQLQKIVDRTERLTNCMRPM